MHIAGMTKRNILAITNQNNNNMKKILLITLIALLPTFCHAGDWIEIASQDDETYYIYSDIQKEYGNYLVWIKTTYDTEQKRKQQMVKLKSKYYVFEQKILWVFNSEWTKSALRSVIAYGRKGNVLDSYTAPYDDWQYITPETIGEGWRDAAKYIYENGGN